MPKVKRKNHSPPFPEIDALQGDFRMEMCADGFGCRPPQDQRCKIGLTFL